MPSGSWQAEATIEVAAKGEKDLYPAVALNGVAGKLLKSEATQKGSRQLTYALSPTALRGKGFDAITVSVAGTGPVTVQRVEVGLFPGR